MRLTKNRFEQGQSTSLGPRVPGVILCLGLTSGLLSGCVGETFESRDALARYAQARDFRAEDLPSLENLPLAATSLSVDDAYQAIPHRRTVFEFSESLMPQEEAMYLELAFRLVEEATRNRVSLLRTLSSNSGPSDTSIESSLEVAAGLEEFWNEVTPPEPLAAYHMDIAKTLLNQNRFFAAWVKQGSKFPYQSRSLASSPDVKASSRALRHAYALLMKLYPGEGSKNKDALFDYHCALDFL